MMYRLPSAAWPFAAAMVALAGCGDSSSEATPDTTADTTTGPVTGLTFEAITIPDDSREITFFAFLPDGSGDVITLEKGGRLAHYTMADDALTLRGEATLPVHDDLDCGLLQAAFDPAWATNRWLYLVRCDDMFASSIIRVTFDPPAYDDVASSVVDVITVRDDRADRPWHNIGSFGFEPSGVLWALSGDKRHSANAQDWSSNAGKLLRIVPASEGGYTPAPDNPFAAGTGSESPDAYATGLRSPWRGVYDAARQRWLFGDVGDNNAEEVNVVTGPAQNFGWPRAEGACSGDCGGLVDPLAWWPHDDDHPYIRDDADVIPTGGRVAWVDMLYAPTQGDRYEGLLTDRVLFGDMCLGFVRALELDDNATVIGDTHVGHLAHVSAWAQGPDDFVYAITFGQCESTFDPAKGGLFRAVPAR